MKYTILMADIVKSGNKDDKQLMSSFKNNVLIINKKWKRNIISPLTITLGDEFQSVIDSVENALKLIIDFEELILKSEYKFKLRYVLNFGEISTDINKKNAYEMLGVGLTDARKILNSMKNSDNRFLILLNKEDNVMEQLINSAFKIFQYFIDSWKVKNFQIASEFILQNDYKLIANNYGLNKSTTWRKKKSLNIEEYDTIKKLILNLAYVHNHS